MNINNIFNNTNSILDKISKIKTYEFNQKGLRLCILDVNRFNKARNIKNIKTDLIWSIGMIVLFSIDVIGSKWIISYLVGIGTSRVVKILVNR